LDELDLGEVDMRRNAAAWVVVVAVVLGGSVYASDFFMTCGDSCAGSDSGTASGDGSGTVHTSNGSAGFTGAVPTFTSLGLQHPKDLRFMLSIGTNLPHTSASACILGSAEISAGFTDCNYTYSSVLVRVVRFFVMTDSFYCTGTPSPCRTVGDVDIGGTNNQTLQEVIFSAELINANGGIQLDEGESTKLHMTGNESHALLNAVNAVRAVDPGAEFYLGFAVNIAPVDPDPKDTTAIHFVTNNTSVQLLTIQAFAKKS
jgi:hypothetical protein